MIINPSIFLEYSLSNLQVWLALIGQKIKHSIYGRGTIKEIQLSDNIRDSIAIIQFDQLTGLTGMNKADTKKFGLIAFNGQLITELSLPAELIEDVLAFETDKLQLELQRREEQLQREEAERQQQLEREANARDEFRLAQNEQELKRFGEKQDRAKSIQKYCVENRITKLIHFTRLENLKWILRYGLLSRKSLQEFSQIQHPIFNDSYRFDGHLEAICLSISFPNYKMFYKLRQDNPNKDWAVLVIDSRILWEFDCAFYTENAASNIARNTSIQQRKEYSSFVEMFSDYNHIKRSNLCIPNNYPTNPQAEVLVFESINPEYILEVHFRDEATMQNWLTESKESFVQKFVASRSYFEPRTDCKQWQSNSSVPVPLLDIEDDFPF